MRSCWSGGRDDEMSSGEKLREMQSAGSEKGRKQSNKEEDKMSFAF